MKPVKKDKDKKKDKNDAEAAKEPRSQKEGTLIKKQTWQRSVVSACNQNTLRRIFGGF
ncbi:MAG: hypothetical protein IPO53_00435 [Chitinophagaceae bacterium]|nr:hypothetical protein [Chitinophagaceae bacterium]